MTDTCINDIEKAATATKLNTSYDNTTETTESTDESFDMNDNFNDSQDSKILLEFDHDIFDSDESCSYDEYPYDETINNMNPTIDDITIIFIPDKIFNFPDGSDPLDQLHYDPLIFYDEPSNNQSSIGTNIINAPQHATSTNPLTAFHKNLSTSPIHHRTHPNGESQIKFINGIFTPPPSQKSDPNILGDHPT